jgi:hypothetical protein
MSNFFRTIFFVSFFMVLSSFTIHKFYVAIYQIDYVSDKKMLHITSRIFVDDLNDALTKKYKTKTFLGENQESQKDIDLMKKYISEHFFISINGKKKQINFANKEIDGNIIICYYNVKDVPKIKQIEIENQVLFEYQEEQQNIIHTNIQNIKKSFLFTSSNAKGMLKY